MAMEHRWSERNPTRFDAILKYPPLGLVCGRVRNASLGGMFVETGPIALHVNTPVELAIRRQGHPADKLYRLRALVVRVVEGGAGLMFRNFDDVTLRTLRELECVNYDGYSDKAKRHTGSARRYVSRSKTRA